MYHGIGFNVWGGSSFVQLSRLPQYIHNKQFFLEKLLSLDDHPKIHEDISRRSLFANRNSTHNKISITKYLNVWEKACRSTSGSIPATRKYAEVFGWFLDLMRLGFGSLGKGTLSGSRVFSILFKCVQIRPSVLLSFSRDLSLIYQHCPMSNRTQVDQKRHY